MSRNLKISTVLFAIFVALVTVVVLTGSGGDSDSGSSTEATSTSSEASSATGASEASVVAPDPRRLGPPGSGGVTFTEFLDFECEACGAAFPAIEQLRRDYAGQVTFNIRYFPVDSHRNARNAAIAVEAAAQQGALEEMYERMFETQTSWAEQSSSKAAVFRGYAEDLGLDMEAFDAAVADPQTEARVERDLNAGVELGVQGTPTFFINEQLIEPRSVEDIRQQIDAALQGA